MKTTRFITVVERSGIIHYFATCDSCDFFAGIQSDNHKTCRDVLRAVRAHVNATGYIVVIESGGHTRYSRVAEKVVP